MQHHQHVRDYRIARVFKGMILTAKIAGAIVVGFFLIVAWVLHAMEGVERHRRRHHAH